MNLPKGFHYGRIIALRGTWGSGLATLSVEDSNGAIIGIPCDNAPTVRALDLCFGGVIGPGHTFNGEACSGQEIIYSYDEYGLLLGGFTPLDDWDPDAVATMEEMG